MEGGLPGSLMETNETIYPKLIGNWIANEEVAARCDATFEKICPASEEVLAQVARSGTDDVQAAIESSRAAFKDWSQLNVIERAGFLRESVKLIEQSKMELAHLVSAECGKSLKESIGEVGAVIECGTFFAGEGRRYTGETIPSGAPNRVVRLERRSIGTGALFTPYNNPAACVAWKLYPSILCGNTIVMKSHEYTPAVPIWFAKLFKKVGLPSGVFSVVQGFGAEVGKPLVEDDRIDFISFTGSSKTASSIVAASAPRLAKVSIEAGGKNPYIVCDDANIEHAVDTCISCSFVDAGQRCAASSRIILFDKIYDRFKERLIWKLSRIKIGVSDDATYGAIISKKRLDAILAAIDGAVDSGAKIIYGGGRVDSPGYFLEPCILEDVAPKQAIACEEIFGPVICLFRVSNIDEAIELANDSAYGLVGAIHTSDMRIAHKFTSEFDGGLARVNGPTNGSEPHMPFGGSGLSGNGWREPGTKALDFYADWKQITYDFIPSS